MTGRCLPTSCSPSEQIKSVPFIIVPHGDPHSNCANTFSLDFSFLALSGFALVLVNYRGSTGMGAATVEFLEGRVGDVFIHVDKVKAPTLISIGTNDLRVPYFNGKTWYHHLKTNNVKTKLLVYDDNHQLLRGLAEIDHIINDCIWLLEHLKKNDDAESENE